MNSILIILEAILRMLIFFIGSGIAIFLGFMIVQLISYRIFNFNLYKKLNEKLFD